MRWRTAVTKPPNRNRGTRYTDAERREIVRLIDSGMAPMEVAMRVGVPIYRTARGDRISTVYQLYERWSGRYEATTPATGEEPRA